VPASRTVDLLADALQRFAARSHVNVNDAPDLGVVDFSGRIDLADIRNRAQCYVAVRVTAAHQCRRYGACLPRVLHGPEAGRTLSVQRDVLEILHGHVADPMIRVLHGDEVVVATVGVNPEAGRYHAAGGERGDHIVDDFLRTQAHHAGSLSIDIQLQTRIVNALRNVDIAYVGHSVNLGGQRGRKLVGLVHVLRFDLDVDGSGQALIDDGIDEPSSLVIG